MLDKDIFVRAHLHTVRIVVRICQQMRITVKLSFIITFKDRQASVSLRPICKGGGVYLEKKSAKFDDAPV